VIKIASLDQVFGQFRHFVIFVRLNDVAIDFLQVAPQDALFSGHWPSSSKIRVEIETHRHRAKEMGIASLHPSYGLRSLSRQDAVV